jgi:hypothetical protein
MKSSRGPESWLCPLSLRLPKRAAPFCRLSTPSGSRCRSPSEAAAVGSATERALAYRSRDPDAYLYPNSAWQTPFIGGSYEFLRNGARLLDARSFFFFMATGITPAMALKTPGAGSQYAIAVTDAKGQPFDGGKTYRLHLPSNVFAKNFWSLVLYDAQFPSISSENKAMVTNPDTSVDVYSVRKRPRQRKTRSGGDISARPCQARADVTVSVGSQTNEGTFCKLRGSTLGWVLESDK